MELCQIFFRILINDDTFSISIESKFIRYKFIIIIIIIDVIAIIKWIASQ